MAAPAIPDAPTQTAETVGPESAVAVAAAAAAAEDDFQVTAYDVTGKVDYRKLIERFGTKEVDAALLARLQALTTLPLHPWLRRGLFYSHRSLDEVCTALEKKQPVYLYTGRGASSGSLHLGHLMPFMFTKWLQDAFDLPLVIQMTDDEKFFAKDMTLDEARLMARENIKDIISVGFDPKNTFIFCDTEYLGAMYPNVCRLQKCMNVNQIQKAFGFSIEDNVGKYAYAAIQAAPSFSSSFPHIFGPSSNYQCLIPCAIDQDPFFRITRDIAPRLHFKKPAVLHSKFFPALQGAYGKMSSSDPNSAIFMDDTPEAIDMKIRKYAFSGGKDNLAEHRLHGADIDVDVSIQYLNVFLFDDAELDRIKSGYKSGQLTSSEVKSALINLLVPLTKKLQEARALVSDERADEFMRPRALTFGLSETVATAVAAAAARPKVAVKAPRGGATPASAAAAAAPAAGPTADQTAFSRLDIRVGVIVSVAAHPNADSLYVSQVDVGDASGPRQIVSGLVKHVTNDEMSGRHVVVLCNLKPAKLRQVESAGMILCSIKDEKVVPLSPPDEAPAGTRLTCAGHDGVAEPVLNPKKKYWEGVQPSLTVADDLTVTYSGIVLTSIYGPATGAVAGAAVN